MLRSDFGQLCRYATLVVSRAKVRMVFMGNLITGNLLGPDAALFMNSLFDRGISGQTTPQAMPS